MKLAWTSTHVWWEPASQSFWRLWEAEVMVEELMFLSLSPLAQICFLGISLIDGPSLSLQNIINMRGLCVCVWKMGRSGKGTEFVEYSPYLGDVVHIEFCVKGAPCRLCCGRPVHSSELHGALSVLSLFIGVSFCFCWQREGGRWELGRSCQCFCSNSVPRPHYRSLFSLSCFSARSGPIGLNWVHFCLCPPGNLWQYPETLLVVTPWEGFWWVEDRDAAECPTVCHITPNTENDLAPRVNSDRVVKHALGKPLRLHVAWIIQSNVASPSLPGTALHTVRTEQNLHEQVLLS